jgi:hypothetical protein
MIDVFFYVDLALNFFVGYEASAGARGAARRRSHPHRTRQPNAGRTRTAFCRLGGAALLADADRARPLALGVGPCDWGPHHQPAAHRGALPQGDPRGEGVVSGAAPGHTAGQPGTRQPRTGPGRAQGTTTDGPPPCRLQGWFAIDVLATLPVDYIVRAVEGTWICSLRGNCLWSATATGGSVSAISMFRVLRVFRCARADEGGGRGRRCAAPCPPAPPTRAPLPQPPPPTPLPPGSSGSSSTSK